MRYKMMALLICCLAISLIVAGGRPASAYTSEKVLSVPTVTAGSRDASLGTLLINEEYAMSIKKGDSMSVILPAYIELQTLKINFPGGDNYIPFALDETVSYAVYSPGASVSLGSSGITLLVEDKNRFSLRVDTGWGSTNKTFRCYVNFASVKIKGWAPEGDEVKATLDGTGGFSSSVQTVAKIYSTGGGTTATAGASQVITDQGRIATIIISENVTGALKKNTDSKDAGYYKKHNTVKLVLPAGFNWGTVTTVPGRGFGPTDVTSTVEVDTSGYSVLYLQVNKETTGFTGPGLLTIAGNITVDERIARAGKIEVSYEGTNPGVSPAVLTVADYSVPGCSVRGKTTTEVIAGHVNQLLGEFIIIEGMAGDLAKDRSITLTLPEGVKWHTPPNTRLGVAVPVGDDGRVIKYTVSSASSEKSVYSFKYGTVDLAVNAPEQVEITVGGPAGVKGKVVVAHVIAPVKLSAAGKTNVSADVQSQDGGEVTIIEEMPGALRGAGSVIELSLPGGFTFDMEKLPQVEVKEGNLILDKGRISLAQGGRVLVIPVEKSSSLASTIKVSKISLNANRMVPEGDVTLEVGGAALSETGNLFSGSLNTMKVSLATCVTPAPGDIKVCAVFTIGSDTYEVNGMKQKMNVAPYIKDGRTYGPVRYIAYALGLGEQNILWDEAAQTVTLIRGKRVVQLKVNRPSVYIQGVEMPIDVAPELVYPGRVMLPYRWVAFALGAGVTWSEEKQQVTLQTM